MATYNTVVLAQRPKGDIKAGETFKLKPEKRIEESDLKDGQVLVESRYLSLDPAMRGWLNGMTTNSSPITSKYKVQSKSRGRDYLDLHLPRRISRLG
jgi:NADPH-dependent curcumin reductase CurA